MKKIATIVFIAFSMTMSFAQQPQDTLRILGFGNSWTRDSMRWLSAIAKSAGKPVIVGHAYLGGSRLADQYLGIDDDTYQYLHGTKLQTVHSTYQYWRYDCSNDPVKTPADKEYRNGTAGTGVTLESVVKDEPWDIIIFQPEQSAFADANFPSMTGREINGYELRKLITRVKAMMAPAVAAKVQTGIMVPFSYPKGCTRHTQAMHDSVGKELGDSQEDWDLVFERYHELIQKRAGQVAEYLGEDCKYYVNVGQAIHNGRQNDILSKSGYKLQRSIGNTHLSEGIAMYTASLCYAYCLLGIGKDEAIFYPAKSKDPHLTGDTGKTEYTSVANTPEMAGEARNEAWKALHPDFLPR